MRLPFVAEAADDLAKAAAWYESKRRGYGARLVSEVMRAVERPRPSLKAAHWCQTWIPSETCEDSWFDAFPTR